MDLQIEHHAVPGVDFMPMPLDQARAFRISGEGKMVLRATLVVEPRDQGRGPLKGRIASLAAHHPGTGQLVHSWNLQGAETPAAPRQNETPWTGELLASLIGPTLEPRLDPRAFDMARGKVFQLSRAQHRSRQSAAAIPLVHRGDAGAAGRSDRVAQS